MKKILMTTASMLLTLSLFAGALVRHEKHPRNERTERSTYIPSMFYGDKQAHKLKKERRKHAKVKIKLKKKSVAPETCTSPKKLHKYQPPKRHRRSF